MANRGRPSVNKRKKEEARKERLKLKAVRRAERHAEKEGKPEGEGGEGIDPDIAGIVPGPQPKTEEWGDEDGGGADDEESETA